MEPMRFFNTEGPVRPDDHYCIPPLERIDLDAVLGLVRDKKYFVLHAPRQTGKTSALLALRDLLNRGGDYRCVYAVLRQLRAGCNQRPAGFPHSVIVFDRARECTWAGKIFRRDPAADGAQVTVWGM